MMKELAKLAGERPDMRAALVPLLKDAASGPSIMGRNWKEIKDGLGRRWAFDDKENDLSFGVYEFQGPGIPLYRLQLLFGPDNKWGIEGMFKLRRQFKAPQLAFAQAAWWRKALIQGTGVDMTGAWSKMGSEKSASRVRDLGQGANRSDRDAAVKRVLQYTKWCREIMKETVPLLDKLDKFAKTTDEWPPVEDAFSLASTFGEIEDDLDWLRRLK